MKLLRSNVYVIKIKNYTIQSVEQYKKPTNKLKNRLSFYFFSNKIIDI